MVRIEGTLEELRELFVEGVKDEARKVAKKAGKSIVKKTVKKTVSAWQRYMGNKKNQVKFKSGSKKGRLDLKKMAIAYRKTPAGKKARR
jgi:hypothetical protein